MNPLIIGIVVVVVLLIIVAMVAVGNSSMTSPKWKHENKMNYVWGKVSPKSGSQDGNVSYLGEYADQTACENACEQRPDCHAYTWHDGNGGVYANQCFGLKNVDKRVPDVAHWSGERSEGFSAGGVLASVQNAAAGVIGNATASVKQALGIASKPEHHEHVVFGPTQALDGTFSNTLQRRLGMSGAGEGYSTDSRKGTFEAERFSSSGQARNTIWDGYMGPAAKKA